jgi:hypothetical protein
MRSSQPVTLLASPASNPELLPVVSQSDSLPRVIKLPEALLRDIESDLSSWEGNSNRAYSKVGPEPGEPTRGLFQEIAAELALHDVEHELKTAVTELGPKLSGSDDPEIHDEILAREKSFFTKVVGAAFNMAESQPGPVALMFDVDYTILHRDPHTPRPAFALAIRELDNILGDRLQVGLLTTRSQESLVREWYHPIYTAAAHYKLNPDFLISSGDMDRPGHPVHALIKDKDTAAKIKAAQDVLDPAIIEAVRDGKLDVMSFYDSKLITLQELSARYPSQSFIAIDDLPYASAINDHSLRVKGVRVNKEILDDVLRPYRKPLPAKVLEESSELLAT